MHCYLAFLVYTVLGILTAAVYVSHALLKTRRLKQ